MRVANQVAKTEQDLEEARVLKMLELSGKLGCNAVSSVCVLWEKNDEPNVQSRGKGIAFRLTPGEHYAEIKTQGYSLSIVLKEILSSLLNKTNNSLNDKLADSYYYNISKNYMFLIIYLT